MFDLKIAKRVVKKPVPEAKPLPEPEPVAEEEVLDEPETVLTDDYNPVASGNNHR